MRSLGDPLQPQAAREEAAESLAYLDCVESIPVLIDALRDPDGRIRFWSVFALGSVQSRRAAREWHGRRDSRVVPALESRLGDDYVPSGNWWSVGHEALAMLAAIPDSGYEEKLDQERARIESDRNALDWEKHWAKCHE